MAPRANRHFCPGTVWHVTHRCHKREFLLKFRRDKDSWRQWMILARERYDLCVLNYTITSNHVHLVLHANRVADPYAIARSLQLAAGQVGREYNARKERRGAFWEDRYHATAIETGEHFTNCLAYVDLNMVRAGVVSDPSKWPYGAYHELQRPRSRFRAQLVDWDALLRLLSMPDIEALRRARRMWIENAILTGPLERDPKWTESLAVGSRKFIEETARRMGGKAIGRVIVEADSGYALQEERNPYEAVFRGENSQISPKKLAF